MVSKTNQTRTVTDRREQIAKMAIKLFVKQGVSKTSMRQLAKAAGMTTGGLYHYFSSKDDIIDLVVDMRVHFVDRLTEYRTRLQNMDSTEVLRECIRYAIKEGDKTQDILIFMSRETLMIGQKRVEALMQSVYNFVQFFKKLMDEEEKAGEFEVDNPTLVAFNIWSSMSEWALRRWFLRKLFTVDEYAEKQAEVIMKQISC